MKLRREFTLDTNRPSAYVPAGDEVTINQLEDSFNYAFPHEVEHRLFYRLFGNNRNSVSVNEIKAAFRGDSPMWKISNDGEQYFFDNNFEEIINRFTQIKNALGVKKARALTAEELKKAYKMFKEGSPKIEDNDMALFFDSIKDWKAAAKLSGKALTGAGLVYTGVKTTGNE